MENDGFKTYLGKAYRFMTFDGLFTTIKSQSLRFTRIDSLNDPLDCSPYLAPVDWSKFQTSNITLSNYIRQKAFSKYYKDLYICCFCKEYDTLDSYLMWSHYGKNHTELCFEIDFNKNNYWGGPSEITYPDNLGAERDYMVKNKIQDFGLFITTTKLKQWCYEQEVRLIVDKNIIEEDLLIVNSSDNDRYIYVKLDLSFISKVIFGANSKNDNEIETIKLFDNLGLIPKFYKMIINPHLMLQSIPY